MRNALTTALELAGIFALVAADVMLWLTMDLVPALALTGALLLGVSWAATR